jgi:hypothetical protein
MAAAVDFLAIVRNNTLLYLNTITLCIYEYIFNAKKRRDFCFFSADSTFCDAAKPTARTEIPIDGEESY